MKIRSLSRLTLISTVVVGSFIAGVPSEAAAGESSITLATPQLVEGDGDRNGEPDDADGRADDLIIAFTERGFGNSKGAIVELSVTRTVTVTCVHGVSQFSVAESERLEWFDGDDPSDPTTDSETNDQKAGRWVLDGTFLIRTSFNDVCTRSDQSSTNGGGYFVKDYSVTYTDVVVKDSGNGVEASDPGPYSFQDPLDAGFTTPDLETAGVSCTIYDLERGHCGAA